MSEQKTREYKLTWHVAKGEDGRFVRRKNSGDGLGLDYIDVEWKHSDGFPADKVTEPVSFDYATKATTYKTTVKDARAVWHDQVIVAENVTDGTVAVMLDEKRHAIAKAHNLEP